MTSYWRRHDGEGKILSAQDAGATWRDDLEEWMVNHGIGVMSRERQEEWLSFQVEREAAMSYRRNHDDMEEP